jgi:hypothetical protein
MRRPDVTIGLSGAAHARRQCYSPGSTADVVCRITQIAFFAEITKTADIRIQ